jgi:hypothetical protein
VRLRRTKNLISDFNQELKLVGAQGGREEESGRRQELEEKEEARGERQWKRQLEGDRN